MKSILLGFAAALMAATAATGAEVKVLSAGAVEPGLHKAVELFEKTSGHKVSIQFNTAPQIAKRMADGYVADVLIAPPAALDGFVKDGKVATDGRVAVGRVGAGITVRNDAPVPAIATTDELKASLLKADSLVYNTASTGLYLERLFDRIGIGAELKPKTARHANGDAVMNHIIKGKGNEIGFGAITEIKMFSGKGQLKYVGPLPADIQNYTSYGAVMMNNATERQAGQAFLTFLGSPQAKAVFVEAGIE